MVEEGFKAKNSLLHRLDPRVKIVTIFSFSVVVALSEQFVVLISALVAGLAIALLAKVSVKDLVRRIIPVNLFILFLWLFLPFTVSGDPVFSLGPFVATSEGFLYATEISLKSNAIVIALSRPQPGEKHELRLVFSKAPETKIEASLILVYQWDVELPEQEAKLLALRAVAYISCAIYDAARSAGLPCQASPIPNGRRPAWLIAGERVPIALTLSDVEISQRACQMSVGPMMIALGTQPVNVALLARLLDGLRAQFSRIRV